MLLKKVILSLIRLLVIVNILIILSVFVLAVVVMFCWCCALNTV